MGDVERVRGDFDRIAEVGRCEGAGPYGRFLEACVPRRCGRAFELGCGSGGFSRVLAAHAERVVAIDLSQRMIDRARLESRGWDNLEFVVADAHRYRFEVGGFDCAVSIATLHHLDFGWALEALAGTLAPGGTLVVHDLFADGSAADRMVSVVAWLASLPDRRRNSAAERAAWAEHARHDRFMTLAEVRRRASAILPGARVTRHLRWRYTLCWRKPAT